MVKTVALSTTAFFAFSPGNDVVRATYAKQKKMKVDNVPKDPEAPEMIAEFQRIKDELIEAEKAKPFFKQVVEGDASETGLVKFIQPLLCDKYGGEYENGLDGIREAFPILKYGKDEKIAQIPFTSDIKFNCLIRDANPKVNDPSDAKDNITLFLKGAPDRVIKRCSNILVKGEI